MKKYVVFVLAAVIAVLACSAAAFSEDGASREVLEIEGDLPSEGIIGRHYSGKLTTHNRDTYWYLKDGKLPTGLRNIYEDIRTTSEFYVMGFPKETGTFTFTVEAHNVSSMYGTRIATRTFTITIKSTSDEPTTPDEPPTSDPTPTPDEPPTPDPTPTPSPNQTPDSTPTPNPTPNPDNNRNSSGGGGGGCNAGIGLIALLAIAIAFKRSR